MTRIPVDQNAAESIPGAAFAAADRHAVSSVSTSERDERCGIAWRRAHDITGPVNAWTGFRSHSQAGNGFHRTGVGTRRPYARRIRILTSEARAPVTEIQDRLTDLYVQQDEAPGEQNPDRARELQVEIDKATARREEIRRRAPS